MRTGWEDVVKKLFPSIDGADAAKEQIEIPREGRDIKSQYLAESGRNEAAVTVMTRP